MTSQVTAQEAAGIRGESPGTRKRLADAEQLLVAGKPAAAREALSKIIDDNGDDLILIEDGRYRSARGFANTIMAKLPPEQLELERNRVDTAARKLLEEGLRRRDTAMLQEVVDRYFVSRPAEKALLALGELALERGDFSRAIRSWTLLLPGGPEHYPQPQVKAEEVNANLSRALNLAKVPSRTLPRHDDWCTLGGDTSRTGCVPGSLITFSTTPRWSVSIPGATPGSPLLPSTRNVAFHPVIDERYTYLAEADRIVRFDLASGVCQTVFELGAIEKEKSTWRDADFTLTLSDGNLYARLGEAVVLPGDSNTKRFTSRILCIEASSAKVLWSRTPPVSEGVVAGWEGAPVVAGGRIYAAFVRVEGGRIVSAVACYDESSDKLLWVTDVCEAATTSENRERQEVLTLAGANVVFASQSGAIVALNVTSGKPAWGYRYARVLRSPLEGRYRDLSPPVASGGRVFVAPNDSDRLFAFNESTGAMLWQSEPLIVDHIIGVSHGKVIASIAGPQRGLRAFDAVTGKCDAPEGWQQHDDPALATFGRGLIVNDLIAWPTQAGLYLIRIEDGLPARPLLRGVQGNLAYADGRLLVASPKTLSLFTVESIELPKAEPVTLAKIPVQTRSVAPLPAIEPASLTPVLSATPAITLVERAPRGTTFQPPADGEWARKDGRPALLATPTSLDAVLYRTHELLRAEGGSLTRQSLDGTLRWRIDFPLAITELGESNVRLGDWHTARFDPNSGMILLIADAAGRAALWPHVIESSPWIPREQPVLFTPRNSAGLASVAPAYRRIGNSLFVLVNRNHGSEIERLSPEGQPLWRESAFAGPHAVRLADCDADSERLFVVQASSVKTFTLEDGAALWETALPSESRWSLHALANGVVAIPRGLSLIVVEPLAFVRHSPFQVLAATTHLEPVPILVLDPATGAIVHRLTAPGEPIIAVTTDASGLWFATPRAIYRLN